MQRCSGWLESVYQLFSDSGVESVTVAQPGGDECLRDSPSGVLRQPFEAFSQHA